MVWLWIAFAAVLEAALLLLAAAVFVCMNWTPLKKLHPILFIAAAAVVGIVFQF